MRIIHKHKDEVRLLVENSDDLWYLNTILDKGDVVSGRTIRKVKTGEESDASRRPVFLSIRVERVEFSPEVLRVLGVITEAPEDIPLGQHHSFSVVPGETVKIVKQEWLSYHWSRLKEAVEQKRSRILVVVFDRESALFAVVKQQGVDVLSKLQGDAEKKMFDSKSRSNFFSDIAKQVNEYELRSSFDNIVLASPSFWKDNLARELSFPWKSKVVTATVSSVDESGVREALQSEQTSKALADSRASAEIRLVEELLTEISKNGKIVYGLKDVADSVSAVERLLVSNVLIESMRLENKFGILESVFKGVEAVNGRIFFIGNNDGGRKIDGLGGIAAFLRYRVTEMPETLPQH